MFTIYHTKLWIVKRFQRKTCPRVENLDQREYIGDKQIVGPLTKNLRIPVTLDNISIIQAICVTWGRPGWSLVRSIHASIEQNRDVYYFDWLRLQNQVAKIQPHLQEKTWYYFSFISAPRFKYVSRQFFSLLILNREEMPRMIVYISAFRFAQTPQRDAQGDCLYHNDILSGSGSLEGVLPSANLWLQCK